VLNARTVPDRYPVRHIHDFSDQLSFLDVKQKLTMFTVGYLVCRLPAPVIKLGYDLCHAVAQAASSQLPTSAAQIGAQVRSCEFFMDKAVRGEVLSKYFCFSRHSFHQLLQTHHHDARYWRRTK
jgi:hypothetical protein